MKLLRRPLPPHVHAAPIEARLAARLAGALTLQAEKLPHDVAERLRFGREQALSRVRRVQAQLAEAVGPVSVTQRGAVVLGGPASWWQRAASVLPLLLLVGGLIAIDRWMSYEEVQAAADIDAQLLSDDLPPAAYSDPGFVEFLRNPPSAAEN